MKIEINQKFQIAQQSITAIYDVLEDNKDFADIEYWIANETISNNENYLNLVSRKFGHKAMTNVKEMSKIRLKRKLLNN